MSYTKIDYIFAHSKAKVAQLVEHDLAKVGVAGSNPVFRSDFRKIKKFQIELFGTFLFINTNIFFDNLTYRSIPSIFTSAISTLPEVIRIRTSLARSFLSK